MKAITAIKYGSPDVLKLQDVVKPKPANKEVLVKVYAAGVTTGDARVRSLNVPRGFGILTRLMFGISKPRNPILGMDFAGEVEVIGKDVKSFKPGDAVFGSCEAFGSYAQYLTIEEDKAIAPKPMNLSYEESAAIPFGALAALTYLRDLGKIHKGQHVLINGASGSLGTYAVQLGKYFGARVTGVCSTSNVDWVKELGADMVIDYTRENFLDRDEKYDIIFDTVGKLYFSDCKKVLKDDGRFLMAVAGFPQFMQMGWTAIGSRKKAIGGVALSTKENLITIKKLVESEKIKPVIDREYRLENMADAHRYIDSGHKKGNVIVTVSHGSKAMGKKVPA